MSGLYETPWKDPKRLGLPCRTQVLFANRQWAVTPDALLELRLRVGLELAENRLQLRSWGNSAVGDPRKLLTRASVSASAKSRLSGDPKTTPSRGTPAEPLPSTP